MFCSLFLGKCGQTSAAQQPKNRPSLCNFPLPSLYSTPGKDLCTEIHHFTTITTLHFTCQQTYSADIFCTLFWTSLAVFHGFFGEHTRRSRLSDESLLPPFWYYLTLCFDFGAPTLFLGQWSVRPSWSLTLPELPLNLAESMVEVQWFSYVALAKPHLLWFS